MFNSHGRRRQELVTFKVSKPDVLVYVMAPIEDEEEEEEAVPTQISPVFSREAGELVNTEFQITFLATVPALGMQTYFVRQVSDIFHCIFWKQMWLICVKYYNSEHF